MSIDIICFSHLRWDFVYQRPQHLMSRFARESRVFFFEEPVFSGDENLITIRNADENNVNVVVPHLKQGLSSEEIVPWQQVLLDRLLQTAGIKKYRLWYYSPMALAFSNHLSPVITVYDCMDELSAFKNAPPELNARELELFQKADIVFTGGHTLYEAKKEKHPNIFAFPSSIDKVHFSKARTPETAPDDQAAIAHPRLGFYGVLDERLDLELIQQVASLRPSWQFIFIGPVVKIDPASLPKMDNIHYLGGKPYKDLPAYLGGWDIAIMPFALNESTRFISPTKTPEYLCGGKAVISTSITDVVNDYGGCGFVFIADSAEDFIRAGEKILGEEQDERWFTRIDSVLANNSWDVTWEKMNRLIQDTQDTQKKLVHHDKQ
jgi:glycosyltransferase involved in cell wall biosynthesis